MEVLRIHGSFAAGGAACLRMQLLSLCYANIAQQFDRNERDKGAVRSKRHLWQTAVSQRGTGLIANLMEYETQIK